MHFPLCFIITAYNTVSTKCVKSRNVFDPLCTKKKLSLMRNAVDAYTI